MKALAKRLTLTGHLLPARGLFTFVFVVGLVGLELLSPYTHNDIHDLLASMALVVMGMSVLVRHRQSPLPWLRKLLNWGQAALSLLSGLRYEHGVDLRGTPPLPRRTPRAVWALALALVGWGVLAGLAWAVFPDGWRV